MTRIRGGLGGGAVGVPTLFPNSAASKEGEMKRPPPRKVKLNTVKVWEFLDRLQMSQNRLAKLCGVSSGHMSHLMQGKRSPSAQMRRRLQGAWCDRVRRPVHSGAQRRLSG